LQQNPNSKLLGPDIATKKFGICDLEFVIFPATGNASRIPEIRRERLKVSGAVGTANYTQPTIDNRQPKTGNPQQAILNASRIPKIRRERLKVSETTNN
jgi:regulator of PEP synthase PpsR (kinase-PPPase family)